MAETTIGNLTLGAVDGTSLFEQERTVNSSQVSEKVTSSSIANFVCTSHQFASLKTDAKDVIGAINEANQSGGGASVVQKTQAEYDLLTTEQKMNGSIYKITDNAKMYCLNKAYHPVEECTVAEYNQKSTAQQNDGTIYIQTDAETTGEDIEVSSTDTRTIDEGIADAEGQEIDYSTWSTMTPQEQAAAGKVFVPDFPTATPNATEIPMSSSDNTSVAEAIGATVATITHSNATIKFTKKNGVVYIDADNSGSEIYPTAWTNIGTLPSGFFADALRKTSMLCPSKTSISFIIQPTGAVYIRSSESVAMYFEGTAFYTI